MFEASVVDPDLDPVLLSATDEQLDPIVKIILEAKVSESLSSNDLYKRYAPAHSKYAELIAKEVRAFGGHTVANLMRGGVGPSYAELVRDVADRLKIKYLKDISVPSLERLILCQVIFDLCNKMSEEQRQQLRADFNRCQVDLDQLLQNTQFNNGMLENVSPAMLFMASTVVVASIARMAAFGALGSAAAVGTVASFGLGRVLGLLAGPIGWGATIAYGVFEVGKTAYRVTIPCVVQIALLRVYQQSNAEQRRYLDYIKNESQLGYDQQPKFVTYEQFNRGQK